MFAIFADFNVTNACILINANYARKVFANYLIDRVQKNKYHLFFYDFAKSAQDMFI